MKKLLGLIFHPLLLMLLGLVALGLVVWIAGPMLAFNTWRPLESENNRLICLGLIVLLVFARLLWKAFKARTGNARVIDQLARPAPTPDDPAAANLKTVDSGFAQALQTLRNARFGASGQGVAALAGRWGKRYLYELPWYVIIGAPGSGKTTALVASGLDFPLAAQHGGKHKFRGVGGTRNCDWWFTSQAVLLDTAGRYTTQDSQQAIDSREWAGFLALLKRSRPRQPLNGVLVTVSVTDLLTRNAHERAEHAAALRARVQELHQQLAMRFPIYLLVTKCDLLAGFTDYLGDVDRDTRASPWGFTFALDRQQHSELSRFEAEFDALLKRLDAGLVDRLQQERDVQRRSRIYAFPQQFEGLREVLREFIEEVFSPSQFEADPLLRGVYFISGTQEGTPIDRLLGRAARSFGLERALVPSHAGGGKSYFLTRLLSDLVFAESSLAGTDLKWERRRGAIALAGYGAIALALAAGAAAWGTSYLNNRADVARVNQRVDQVAQQLAGTPNRPTSELAVLLPALEATQQLARGGREGSVPWSLGFGLYQGDKLDTASQQAYRRMLNDAMLPRIALRVEEQLKGADANSEGLYEALKAYVMLYDPARFDAVALKRYVTADWETSLARSVTTEQRQALERHLDELLGDGHAVSPLTEDKALLSRTRARINATALPERIYRRLQRAGVGEDTPAFTIARAAGSGAPLVFRRASGTPLTEGVPGLYTYDGYYKAFQGALERVSKQLADEEGWVLGVQSTSRLQDPLQRDRLADEVRRLYLTDYARRWQDFIADIKMLPTTNLSAAVQMARVLSAPDNPLLPLLRGLVHETTLSERKDLAGKVEGKVGDALKQGRDELSRLLGGKPEPTAQAPGTRIESLVDDRFTALRQFVIGSGQGPAPVDATIGLIGEVYVMLNAADTAVKAGNVAPPSEVPNKVKAEAARLPEPLRAMLQTLSVSGTTAALDQTRINLGAALNANLGDFCRQAVSGRYPFVRSSPRDVTQEDFAKLFAPGGMFDSFFQQQLVNFVDTSTRPWHFKELAGASMGGPGMLAQFQRAAAIRDTFFRAGATTPGLKLDFKPVEMDPTITQFILDVDGTLLKYAHGPQIPVSIQWPGPGGSKQVRVALQPVSASGNSGSVDEGPWALMRLFDRLQLEPGNVPERFKATFNIDGRRAVFEVTTSSVRNPFRLDELEAFACPTKL